VAKPRLRFTSSRLHHHLEALDTQERLPEENSPIGIIICRGKNKTIVEYALRTPAWPLNSLNERNIATTAGLALPVPAT